jgi:hypothetical protein
MKTLCLALISLVSAALFVQALPTPQGTVAHLYGKRIADGDVLIFSTFMYECIFEDHLNIIAQT